MSARQRELRKRAVRVWRSLRAEKGDALVLGYVDVKRLVARVGSERPGLDVAEVTAVVSRLVDAGEGRVSS